MITRLAHVEIAVDDLEAARAFYVDVLGFGLVESDGGRLFLRGADEFDPWSLTITKGSRPGLVHVGFRVESPETLERLTAIHERLGLRIQAVPEGSEPHQGPAIRMLSPDGHPVEFFHELGEVEVYEGPVDIRLPMRRTHEHTGIPPVQLDHVNMRCVNPDDSLRYWRDELGFSVSERFVDEAGVTRIAWTRRRRQSHEVALGVFDRVGLHHFAYTVGDSQNILKVADVLSDAGFHDRIEFGPARHGVSNALAIYVFDPSGNRVEFFAGNPYERDLDRPVITWPFETYRRQGLMWWGAEPPRSFVDLVADIVNPETSDETSNAQNGT